MSKRKTFQTLNFYGPVIFGRSDSQSNEIDEDFDADFEDCRQGWEEDICDGGQCADCAGTCPAFNEPLRPVDWVWPEWLKAECIAQDECGDWFAYEHEPKQGIKSWHPRTGRAFSLEMVHLTPPEFYDWRESMLFNPNLEDAE